MYILLYYWANKMMMMMMMMMVSTDRTLQVTAAVMSLMAAMTMMTS